MPTAAPIATSTGAPGLAPSANLPSFFNSNPWRPVAQYAQQLPALFNTDAQRQNVENQISGNFDSGRSAAAAAASRYANTAAQTGGSAQGAGFAGAQAMLPFYRQANDARAAFGQLDLQARSQQGQIGADLARSIGTLQSQRQSMLSDYFQGQQRLNQSNNQFAQDLDYRNRALQQNQNQFTSGQGQQEHQFDVGTQLQLLQSLGILGGGGGRGSGGGGGSPAGASFSYMTNQNGQPLGPSDVGGFNAFNAYRQGLVTNQQVPNLLLSGAGAFTGGLGNFGGGGSFGGSASSLGGFAGGNYSGGFDPRSAPRLDPRSAPRMDPRNTSIPDWRSSASPDPRSVPSSTAYSTNGYGQDVMTNNQWL